MRAPKEVVPRTDIETGMAHQAGGEGARDGRAGQGDAYYVEALQVSAIIITTRRSVATAPSDKHRKSCTTQCSRRSRLQAVRMHNTLISK